MNLIELEGKAMESKKPFQSTVKKRCEVIIKDFAHPKETCKFRNTEYVHYDCEFISINSKEVPIGIHVLQLPLLTCWLQLKKYLDKRKLTYTKNIHIKINKRNNYHYTFNILHYIQYMEHDTEEVSQEDLKEEPKEKSEKELEEDAEKAGIW